LSKALKALNAPGTSAPFIRHVKPGPSTRSGIFEGSVLDPALRGSEFNGFAGKDGKLFWSTGVLKYWGIAKYQIPNIKSQGFRCQVSGVRFQGGKAKAFYPEH